MKDKNNCFFIMRYFIGTRVKKNNGPVFLREEGKIMTLN